MNQQQQQMTNDNFIGFIMDTVRTLMHEVSFINGFLKHYLFTVMQIPVNSENFRLFTSLNRGGDGVHFLQDMERLLNNVSHIQLERIHRFIFYIYNNRNNRNLPYMVNAYHN